MLDGWRKREKHASSYAGTHALTMTAQSASGAGDRHVVVSPSRGSWKSGKASDGVWSPGAQRRAVAWPRPITNSRAVRRGQWARLVAEAPSVGRRAAIYSPLRKRCLKQTPQRNAQDEGVLQVSFTCLFLQTSGASFLAFPPLSVLFSNGGESLICSSLIRGGEILIKFYIFRQSNCTYYGAAPVLLRLPRGVISDRAELHWK